MEITIKQKFYDTCALLAEVDNVQLFDEFFIISSTTLHELEHIKVSRNKDKETRYKAKKLTRLLDDNYGKYHTVVFNNDIADYITLTLNLDYAIPDNQIIGCACKYKDDNHADMLFVTNDICLKNIARSVGLETTSVVQKKLSYKGYVEKVLNEADMAYFYEHLQENIYGLNVNEYIIIKNEIGEVVDKLKWSGETYETVRSKPFKSNMFGALKPLDEVQAFAMDSINTNDITVLYGKAGSGKTTLPLNYIMQNIEKGKISKCYIVYSFEPLKGAKTLGYEKGDHIQKLIYSAAIGNILASKFGSLDQVEYMINQGTIDIIPTANIRGVEFAADTCVLVTEAQNLDTYTLKTIIQRCKTGCKQIYEGDIIEQKDTNIQDIGLNRMIEVFKGHESFGCVKLKNCYRSPLSDIADKM